MNPLAELLRLALTAAIKANAEARRCSERLAGRSIALETLSWRFLVVFEAGAVRVETGTGAADATVKGSPAAVLAALATDADETAAIFGDTALFDDFRESFRPHLELPADAAYWAEDAADAMRIGVAAARSAVQGLAAALRTGNDRPKEPDQDAAREVAALRTLVGELDQRLRKLEKP